MRVAFDLKQKKLLLVFLASSCAIVILNRLYINSIALGLVSSGVFLSCIAFVSGNLFFHEDPLILRLVNGFFSFFVVLMTIGIPMLYMGVFNPYVSSLIVVCVTVLFLLILNKRKDSGFNITGFVRDNLRLPKMTNSVSLVAIWVASICSSFFILLASRTDEPMISVWYSIPITRFLIVIFISTFVLILLISLNRSHSTLLLIVFQSILFVSLYFLVWYPSLYGDPLEHLAKARFVDRTGGIYALESSISQGNLVDILKYNGLSVFVVFLTRFLNSDIYWVFNVSIPILWAILVPISAYEITCLITNKHPSEYPKEALLASFSAAFIDGYLLVAWGANPTANTFSFLLLFFMIPILLRWFLTDNSMSFVLAVIVLISAFFVHFMPGIIGLSFLIASVIIKKVKMISLRIPALAGVFIIYPTALIFGLGSSFVPLNLTSISNFLTFQGEIVTIPLLFAIIGLFFSLKKSSNRRAATLLTFFYVFVILEFYVQFGIVPMPYGTRRIQAISDFLLAPFLALGLSYFLELPGKISKLRNSSINSKLARIRSSFNLRTSVALALCMLISLQSVLTLYQAYPEHEVELAPTAYEVDAVNYLNSTAPRRFVVIDDTIFANLASGLLGTDYTYGASGGTFGLSDWSYPVQMLYLQMVQEPSVEIFDKALEFASAQVAYFVVSRRLSNFEDLVQEMSGMLPVDKVFGDGKLYIFKYPVSESEGSGPRVTVTYEDGKIDEIESHYVYILKNEVKYTAAFMNHTSYNITNYPKHWVFSSLTVNGKLGTFDSSSDINGFILKSGLSPTDVLNVLWSANDLYPNCGWKEDSFKSGWGPYPGYSYSLQPTISTDGNILFLSGDFTKGVYMDYYYAKRAEVSTDEYQYIIVRWKADGPVAVVYVFFESGGQAIVYYGSQSKDWTVKRIKLDSAEKISYVMVGISNPATQQISGIQTLFVDYILICS